MGICRYPLHGMFHLRERSLSPSDKVNTGAKPTKFTTCPDSSGSASQCIYEEFVAPRLFFIYQSFNIFNWNMSSNRNLFNCQSLFIESTYKLFH